MDNWILVVFVFSLHLTCPDLPFAFCMMTCVCSTTGSEQYCEFGCVLYMSGDGGDQHFCTTTRLANEPGPLRVAICYCVPWMVLAQINYKVPPSTFVDSPKFCGEIISPWSFWKGCPAVHHAWPFLLRFAREAEFACFVVISSLFIRQVFHYIVFPIFSLKSTAWNCVGHHSSSCHVISLQYDWGMYYKYIYIYTGMIRTPVHRSWVLHLRCVLFDWINELSDVTHHHLRWRNMWEEECSGLLSQGESRDGLIQTIEA